MTNEGNWDHHHNIPSSPTITKLANTNCCVSQFPSKVYSSMLNTRHILAALTLAHATQRHVRWTKSTKLNNYNHNSWKTFKSKEGKEKGRTPACSLNRLIDMPFCQDWWSQRSSEGQTQGRRRRHRRERAQVARRWHKVIIARSARRPIWTALARSFRASCLILGSGHRHLGLLFLDHPPKPRL